MRSAAVRDAMVARVKAAVEKWPTYGDMPETTADGHRFRCAADPRRQDNYIEELYECCANSTPIGRMHVSYDGFDVWIIVAEYAGSSSNMHTEGQITTKLVFVNANRSKRVIASYRKPSNFVATIGEHIQFPDDPDADWEIVGSYDEEDETIVKIKFMGRK